MSNVKSEIAEQGATPTEGEGAATPSPTASPEPTVGETGEQGQTNPTIDPQTPIVDPVDPPKRKRGRPSNADIQARLTGVTPPPPRPVPPVAPPVPLAPPVNYETLARTAADLWFNVGQIFLGKEWEPEAGEVMPVKDAFKSYFETAGVTTIPPGWTLALVLGGYTLKRAARPTIREKLTGVTAWLKAKFRR